MSSTPDVVAEPTVTVRVDGFPALDLADTIIVHAQRAAADVISGPLVTAVRAGELDGAQLGGLFARQWSLASLAYTSYPSWHKATVFGHAGEFIEADHFVSLMEFDESRQERAIMSMFRSRDWALDSEQLASRRWQLLADDTVRVAFWWRTLASFSVPARAAGWNLSRRLIEHSLWVALVEAFDDDDITSAMSVQRLGAHIAMGRVLVARYANTPEARRECVWAANTGIELTVRMYREWDRLVTGFESLDVESEHQELPAPPKEESEWS